MLTSVNKGYRAPDLEREIFIRCLLEDTCVCEVAIRIDGSSPDSYLIVQMRRGHPPGASHRTQHFPAPEALACISEEPGEMRVVGFDASAVIDNHQAAVAIAPVGKCYNAVGGGVDRRTGRCTDIDALMEFAFTRERIIPLTEWAHQPAVYRPQTWLRDTPHPPPALQGNGVDVSQEVVILDGLGKAWHQLALGGNISRAVELLLDS